MTDPGTSRFASRNPIRVVDRARAIWLVIMLAVSSSASAQSGLPNLSLEDLMELRLPDLNQNQLKVLRIMSFLGSDGVPRDLLEITDRPGPMFLKTK